MPLLPPTKAKNRSKLADWMELSALLSRAGSFHSNDVQRLVEADSDGEDHGVETDPISGEPLEREILDHESSTQVDKLHEELQYRSRLCAEWYPFGLEYDEKATVGGSFRLRCLYQSSKDQKYIFYLLGLLETAVRDQIVAVQNVNVTNHRLGLLFQVASCLAVGGYLRGETIWFGFPRREKTAFLTALQQAFERYGAHQVLDRVPPGYPNSLKDGGIDILAWIDFGDGRGSRTVVFGQVASGYDWTNKTLLGFMAMFENWFLPPVPAHVKPAILIPFPIHHHLEEEADYTWEEKAAGSLLYFSKDFGVVFDRFRVAKFAAKAFDLTDPEKSRIDGFDQVDTVKMWITEMIGELRPAEIAA